MVNDKGFSNHDDFSLLSLIINHYQLTTNDVPSPQQLPLPRHLLLQSR